MNDKKFYSDTKTEMFGSDLLGDRFSRTTVYPPKWHKIDPYKKVTPMLDKIKMSGIIARDAVKHTDNDFEGVTGMGNATFFLDGEVQIHFKSEDIARWKKWHPKNDFRRSFPEFARSFSISNFDPDFDPNGH